MNQGWQCPKCQNIYAPFVAECGACNKQSAVNYTIAYVNNLTSLERLERLEQLLGSTGDMAIAARS